MNTTIFISCGQYSGPEKQLGRDIAEVVRKLTPLTPFFAEEVQDLNGLDANILRALHECVAFITVLHPRGEITRPDKSVVTRASVWIEQEIAIATYIHRVEKRSLPIIAFKHKSVDLEGIRGLLHLNPIEFTNESEVLTELRKKLADWKSLKPSGIELQLTSKRVQDASGHALSLLELVLENETSQRIAEYDFELRVPADVLRHGIDIFTIEVPSDDPRFRRLRSSQLSAGAVSPRDRLRLFQLQYCTTCAVSALGALIDAILISEATVSATRKLFKLDMGVCAPE